MSSEATIAFGSKAETLDRLRTLLQSAKVLPQCRFSVDEWRSDPEAVIATIEKRGWLDTPVIVRSSALGEDSPRESMAGRFPSIGNRLGRAALGSAIEQVCNGLPSSQGADQVFVQPYLASVRMGGVVLTRDPSNGSHYTIVSFDEASGKSDNITSGRAEDRRTYCRHIGSTRPPPPKLGEVLRLAEELQQLLGQDALDIEFALTQDRELVLLQVRPLIIPERPRLGPDGEWHALEQIRDHVRELSRPHPDLHGTRAIFGNMPDWNPAEVIGVRPKPLAMSLYRQLITDRVWALQRRAYGYRDLGNFPLMVSLGGQPYVDVRVSFNSLLPASLDAELGRRLVDHYAERLIASPPAHDKIEFAIVYSCYSLDLEQRLVDLERHGFSRDECDQIASALKTLTNRITADRNGLYHADLRKIQVLQQRQALFRLEGSELSAAARIQRLLEDCKNYGTIPFVGIARAAFMAVQLLDSLVTTGILSPVERQGFMGSLRTVRGEMDAALVSESKQGFLGRFGHLRPGAYDVTSMRYDETPEAYFDWKTRGKSDTNKNLPAFKLSPQQRRRLDVVLEEHGLAHDHQSLFAFLRAAIEGRENAKFVFTRNLSDALVALVELASQYGISREELAYLDVEVVPQLLASDVDPRSILEASILAGQRNFRVTRQISLPPLLIDPSDALAFELPKSDPNFVTMHSAEGPVVRAPSGGQTLAGAIVTIPSADPGHDWIFSHAIAGFITMYGGYNSHMAIRANELGIPAVIGAGEALFNSWSEARRLSIDCLNRRVEVFV